MKPKFLSWHGPLTVFGLVMVAMIPVSLTGLMVDDRTLVNAPIWAKPFKFAVSLACYSLTLAWFLTFLRDKPRWVRLTGWWAGTLSAGAAAVDMAAIVFQVLRGKRSHFNIETRFDSDLFSFMGKMIIVLWLMHAVVAILLFCTRFEHRGLGWAIRLGLVISLVGLSIGMIMIRPMPGQDLKAGTLGAHSVGGADGGAHLPVTGWNSEIGDMRVPHFIGLHALQALPIAVALLGRRADARLAWVLSAGYVGLLLLTLWQALRGQSVARPDALTLAAFAALATAGGAAIWWATRPATGRDRAQTMSQVESNF